MNVGMNLLKTDVLNNPTILLQHLSLIFITDARLTKLQASEHTLRHRWRGADR